MNPPTEHKFSASLKAGQVPLDSLVMIEKAHDVRKLCVCGSCGGLGNTDSMIERDEEWLHGRCFVSRYGKAELCHLPKKQTDRLTLGDLGVTIMKYLIDHGCGR